MGLKFTDESIHQLFGAEAAESDDPKRLREYYVHHSTLRGLK